MDLGIHLPLVQFGEERFSLDRLQQTVDTARECGFAAVSANDHFFFARPWLDGPTALASVVERTGDMTVATTIALAVLRGPVPLARTLEALDTLSDGRLIAGIGPGSSERDYQAVDIPYGERWKRFDESIATLRELLGERIPLWIGSWGSEAGLRRIARAGDGWLASAYNTTPERFGEARDRLGQELESRGRDSWRFPNALATMWTWVAEDQAEADRVLGEVLVPLLRRDPDELRQQLCIGPPEHCAEILSRYAQAGCERVYIWPLGDERRQIESMAREVMPLMVRAAQ
jgi:alkanesulfonate monooxygenase SsuD/methylene tetrahydromethanopterin reductase-like flavin-dependent oxidoreductase (luciferase family)